MKTCSKCFKEKPYSDFTKQKTGKGGFRADCKECHKKYTYSKEAVASSMYSNQKRKSIKRNHPAPAYTPNELYIWLINQPAFNELYDLWVISGYKTDLKPSCDRIDDYKPYSLNNISVKTVKENVTRYYSDAKAGINTKTATEVDQYTLDGKFIKRHHSYYAAARAVNGLASNIRNVANQITIYREEPNGSIRSWIPKKAYNFVWKKP